MLESDTPKSDLALDIFLENGVYRAHFEWDEAIYNEMLAELDQDIEKSKELANKYDNYDNDLDKKLEKISDIALNAKQIFNSSINSEKHKILKLILSNSVVDGKNLMFSIIKPFDKLFFSKGCSVWYLQPDLNQHLIAKSRF